MASDATSPIAPARIRSLILPVGRVKRKRFHAFVERIRKEDEIRLGDISPDTSPERTVFSPIAFPNGRILYNYSLSPSPAHHLSFSPFELFRQPLLILCVADNAELLRSAHGRKKHEDVSEDDNESLGAKLEKEIQDVRDQFSRALHVQLLVFDVDLSSSAKYIPHDGKTVPPQSQSKSTTMKTIICDISALLLSEMSTTAKWIQQASSLDILGTSSELPSAGAGVSTSSLEVTSSSFSRRDVGRSVSPPSNRNPVDEHPSLSETVNNSSRPASPADSERTSRSNGATGESPRDLSPRSSSVDASNRSRIVELPQGTKRDRKNSPASNLPIDRAKIRLKLRQGILMGSLFLHAGRWPDALRELTESATRARAFGDHRWFAKGLENILISLLLLAWTGMEFTIPSICFANAERGQAGKHSSVNNSTVALDVRPATDTGNRRTLRNLSLAIPEIVNLIVNSHTRANNESGKEFPALIVSDCIVRLARLETILYHRGGFLDRTALSFIVSSNPGYSAFRPTTQPSSNSITKRELSYLLFRAFPVANEMSASTNLDNIDLLSRIASVLSFAGLERKQAMVHRDILSLLTPAFIQARKRGAAELGVHPAASLSILESFTTSRFVAGEENKRVIDSSLSNLLTAICMKYGVKLELDLRRNVEDLDKHVETPYLVSEDSEKQVLAILEEAWLRSFGSISIKSDILRLCANFSEAQPDFEKLMHTITTMLNTIGPDGPYSFINGDKRSAQLVAPVKLSEDEQAKLAAKFYRLVDAVSPEDVKNIEPPFWDKFLIRNVEHETWSDDRALLARTKSEFSTSVTSAATKPQEGLFLHDAISRVAVDPMDEVLVAGESARFIITFQNPFSFEIFVEHLTFVTEEVDLEVASQSLVLGPRLLYKAIVLATPTTPGSLVIHGCRIKIRGCCHRNFLIFRQPWSLRSEVKIKQAISSPLVDPHRFGDYSQTFNTKAEGRITSGDVPLRPTTVCFTVIQSQPLLQVTAASLPQSNVTLLAGQVVPFSVTLKNQSAITTCDFVSMSFQQIVYGKVSSGTRVSAFKDRNSSGHDAVSISPGESMTFTVDVFGEPGLSKGSIIFAYSHFGCSMVDMKEKFYTRQVKVEWRITVNPTTQLLRVDAIPFQERRPTSVESLSALRVRAKPSGPPNLWVNSLSNRPKASRVIPGSHDGVDLSHEPSSFVLLLDLRNISLRPLWISFYVKDSSLTSSTGTSRSKSLLCSRNLVQADQVTRVALLLPRIMVNDIFITRVDKFQRQEMAHATNRAQKANDLKDREILCREALLNRIEGTWKDSSTSLTGLIDLQGLRLNPAMIAAICVREIILDLTISANIEPDSSNSLQFGVNQLLTLTVTVANISLQTLGGVLQLHPYFVEPNIMDDMARHMVWSGAQLRRLPRLKAGQTTLISTGVAFVTPGRYEIQARVLGTEITPTNSSSTEDISSGSREQTRLLGSSLISIIVLEA